MKDTTESRTFFADTYALIEIAKGNPSYLDYTECSLLIGEYNLVEFYYHLLHDHGQEKADEYIRACAKLIVPTPPHAIRAGMMFKFEHWQEKLSYVDCMGYAMALGYGVRFLTGDQKFAGKENVEFVK